MNLKHLKAFDLGYQVDPTKVVKIHILSRLDSKKKDESLESLFTINQEALAEPYGSQVSTDTVGYNVNYVVNIAAAVNIGLVDIAVVVIWVIIAIVVLGGGSEG